MGRRSAAAGYRREECASHRPPLLPDPTSVRETARGGAVWLECEGGRSFSKPPNIYGAPTVCQGLPWWAADVRLRLPAQKGRRTVSKWDECLRTKGRAWGGVLVGATRRSREAESGVVPAGVRKPQKALGWGRAGHIPRGADQRPGRRLELGWQGTAGSKSY